MERESIEICEILIYEIPKRVKLQGAKDIYDFPFSIKNIALGLKMNQKTTKACRVRDGIPDAFISSDDVIIYDSEAKPHDHNDIICIVNNKIDVLKYLEVDENPEHSTFIKIINDNNKLSFKRDEIETIGVVKAIVQYR